MPTKKCAVRQCSVAANMERGRRRRAPVPAATATALKRLGAALLAASARPPGLADARTEQRAAFAKAIREGNIASYSEIGWMTSPLLLALAEIREAPLRVRHAFAAAIEEGDDEAFAKARKDAEKRRRMPFYVAHLAALKVQYQAKTRALRSIRQARAELRKAFPDEPRAALEARMLDLLDYRDGISPIDILVGELGLDDGVPTVLSVEVARQVWGAESLRQAQRRARKAAR